MSPALDMGRVDAYLARLGTPEVVHDPVGLAALQAAHLRAVPFHNLLLLINDGRPYPMQTLDAVIDDAVAGIGGNCDRTTPPFTALLRALGFDATLVAASVREPGDHFVCMVRLGGVRYLCDVGNGHPYMQPWLLDGPYQTQSFQGWAFAFDPNAPEGPTLKRDLGDGRLKTVYVVEPTPRAYEDFAPMVDAHYSRAGFGPFLAGLRAVDIQSDAVLTLRDAEYSRYTRFGRSVRQLAGRVALHAALTGRFRLPGDLVDSALEALSRRRPDLVADEPKWMALGRGAIGDSPTTEAPTRDAVPDILISAATVGRTASVERLLSSIEAELDGSGYPGRVGVLLLENNDGPGADLSNSTRVPVHRVSIKTLAPALARSARVGIVPDCDHLPAPIGAARDAQLHAIRRHLQDPIDGLPHPSAHPMVVWMVDDDMVFEQLGFDEVPRRRTHLFYRAARFWATLPQHQVVLGAYNGDPPVPGLDCLGGQLRDLTANAARMLKLGPARAWQPPPRPEPVYDAYYDLTESARPDDGVVWPYATHLTGCSVREVMLALLRDIPRLLDGQQLTRQLVWDGREQSPKPSLRRGGNALFLDLDAVFRWPTPVFVCADGVATRRADTLWAALALAEDPDAVVEATLPLLHDRDGQSTQPGSVRTAQAAAHSAAQVRGIALARGVTEARPVARELPEREARVAAQRSQLRACIAHLRGVVRGVAVWADLEVDAALDGGLSALDALERLAVAGAPLPGDSTELDCFLAGLPDAVREWRETL